MNSSPYSDKMRTIHYPSLQLVGNEHIDKHHTMNIIEHWSSQKYMDSKSRLNNPCRKEIMIHQSTDRVFDAINLSQMDVRTILILENAKQSREYGINYLRGLQATNDCLTMLFGPKQHLARNDCGKLMRKQGFLISMTASILHCIQMM